MFPSYGAPSQRVVLTNPQQSTLLQGGRIQRPIFSEDVAPAKSKTGKLRLPLSDRFLLLVGLAVLIFAVALPVSDAVTLITDFNYRFWSGQALPSTVLCLLIFVIVLYAIVAGTTKGAKNYSVSDLSTLVTFFTILLGSILVLTSLYLYYREQFVIKSLLYNCKGSSVTQDTRRYYLGYLNLRKTPACAIKWSISECDGFATVAPPSYGEYFKHLEENYHCSGFCNTPANVSMIELPSGEHTPGSFLAKSSEFHQLDRVHQSQSAHRTDSLPPALFSHSKYKTSCDGAAARSLNFLAVGIAQEWWWIAIVLIGMSALVGIAEYLCSQIYKLR